MHEVSAAILAPKDRSRLFQGSKYLSPFLGRPLISSVVDVAFSVANEAYVVASCDDDANLFRESIPTLPGEPLGVFVDASGEGSELTMAETAFNRSNSSRTILLPADAPFLSVEALATMADLCKGRDAVVPRAPTGEMKPVPAVYATEVAARAARDSRLENASEMSRVVEKLGRKMFLSSSVLAEFDKDLLTFFTVNSPLDLKKAEMIASGRLLRKAGERRGRLPG
ncbi:MAG: NTP transferase domain-containing protein [Candidatus Brockarchaeota archaeon]|nr:NTP transferase domain-containing protein [Candidatus Brockarchaeota archaeon]